MAGFGLFFTYKTPEDFTPRNKNKKTWRLFRKKASKQVLQSEIDSLKGVLSQMQKNNTVYQQNKKHTWLDSIGYYLKLNSYQSKKTKQLQKLDFIQEKLHRFHLPIHNTLKVTSPYGMRMHPITGNRKMHNGIDLRAHYENVYAVLDGVISQSGYSSRGGNYIKIQHANHFETLYLHLSHRYYAVGEKVRAGFIIGKSGNSGASTAPHLHFAVKEKGKFINPTDFLNNIIKLNNLIATMYE